MTLIRRFSVAICTAGALTAALANNLSDEPVRVNSIGFVPNLPKKVTIVAPEHSEEGIAFTVRHVIGNEPAYEGVTEPAINNVGSGNASRRTEATGEYLWTADFSDLTADGRYYIDVPGVGRSAEFRIGNDVFVEPYRALMLGMYLWRCGNPGGVSASYNGITYSHGACHLSDGTVHSTSHISAGQRIDGTQGWHDAGDYNKYVVNSGITVGIMLKAWDHFKPAIENVPLIAGHRPADAPELPPFLAEVKWNLDWVSKMQFNDGSVSHKLTTLKFGSMNMLPENNTDLRYFTSYSTAATANFAAQMAISQRAFRDFDNEFARICWNKAVKSYNFLDSVTSNVKMIGGGNQIFETGDYDSDDADDRLWAAAEMWETSGQERYLRDFEMRVGSGDVSIFFDWANVSNMALLTYLFSERDGRNPEIVQNIRTSLISAADNLVNNANASPHGRTFGNNYYWGANGVVARNVYLLFSAYKLTGDSKYAGAAQDALSYLLGRNYYGRSFVTGIGHKPPTAPHCRRSTAQNKVWPGYLIGGPQNDKGDWNANGSAMVAPHRYSCNMPEPCWFDDGGDYWTNEIAINWNSAMIYALASLMPGGGFHDPTVSVLGQPADAPRKRAPAARTVRMVRVQNGKIDIPPGASVYSLNGRLVAKRGLNDANMPIIRRNGVYVVKENDQLININK